MTAPTSLTLILTLERETPGTYVYRSRQKAAIESLYIRKSGFPNPPDQIVLTITPKEDDEK